jgi:hypothetical protein
MRRQFIDVDCRFGAPMGRHEYGLASDCPLKSIRLFKVNLLGDYDDGGAYWGGGLGTDPLYCARYGNTYRQFVRAYTRAHAAQILKIKDEQLRVAL